jgi:hypothetical protein
MRLLVIIMAGLLTAACWNVASTAPDPVRASPTDFIFGHTATGDHVDYRGQRYPLVSLEKGIVTGTMASASATLKGRSAFECVLGMETRLLDQIGTYGAIPDDYTVVLCHGPRTIETYSVLVKKRTLAEMRATIELSRVDGLGLGTSFLIIAEEDGVGRVGQMRPFPRVIAWHPLGRAMDYEKTAASLAEHVKLGLDLYLASRGG